MIMVLVELRKQQTFSLCLHQFDSHMMTSVDVIIHTVVTVPYHYSSQCYHHVNLIHSLQIKSHHSIHVIITS